MLPISQAHPPPDLQSLDEGCAARLGWLSACRVLSGWAMGLNCDEC